MKSMGWMFVVFNSVRKTQFYRRRLNFLFILLGYPLKKLRCGENLMSDNATDMGYRSSVPNLSYLVDRRIKTTKFYTWLCSENTK